LKGLAEFVMRGRLQALLVVMAGAGSVLFCWISAAALALVTLRKGAAAGGWLYLWALLPSGTLVYFMGDTGPIALLTGTMVLALVLRGTVSLPLALLAAIGVGLSTGLMLLTLSSEYLAQLVTYFSEVLASLEQQLPEGAEAVVLDEVLIAGMLGGGTAMMSVLCLLLARYWQAALYNPGGFGLEFRALHYPVLVTLVMVVSALVLFSMGLRFRTWGMLCLIPLSFVGLALVHARAALRGQGTGWLTGFYVVWLLFDPIKLLVVFFAIADSWFNFRQRWSGGPGTQVNPRDGKDRTDDSDS
jgi:hypothetical protein